MEEAVAEDTHVKVIVFQLGDEEYALDVEMVQSIEKLQAITRIPGVEAYIKGVMNLRGIITPVIDLRSRFGMESKSYDGATRILVIHKNGDDIGFIVDEANDVLDIPISSIEPTPEVVGGVADEYLRGVVKVNDRLFTLLHVDKVLERQANKTNQKRK
ncbi:purine-binding chemotaxis protein CheW [Alteribacillus persepolensis]|uniref:Purine-binding chemotaxis protein CheW n=1 Tax=Alteribacillus persepolensis TaxID=568899 RepID=A0A1G8GMD2_9BACI|nr:chemotaxis protein CheW [Alteribacillus persepolensis]SDH95460.1 purine-binding chemotaxis protein CheW [Alteribacillus persepolensis]